MKKRRNFTPEQKTKIVLEVLREEQTLVEIAAKYRLLYKAMHQHKDKGAITHLNSFSFNRKALAWRGCQTFQRFILIQQQVNIILFMNLSRMMDHSIPDRRLCHTGIIT